MTVREGGADGFFNVTAPFSFSLIVRRVVGFDLTGSGFLFDTVGTVTGLSFARLDRGLYPFVFDLASVFVQCPFTTFGALKTTGGAEIG